ncbi:dynamin family protein [Undibacterium sp. RTI2.1]|uniref:dynamin family protein n=1 Tax=unclassified Undibacterium TaxID=2630295 RepID=UPI002AB403E4|nr:MULTISPECIES: dynamin family protein [unclassified Undibacterium]MDY7540291.1 dynamin family protein [Undibacterium sp. 5I1]MEB0029899.1 dynamin family protein [Undibacterium sp. RTI2.1]MEB0118093.1 dynamin family protein [Undibacterium sp. RTI2.2]MEB0231292.1 dynamin family protein [Undibacterium sp. 10I3]MEB0259057.1 dynamin family protein [Undibacterium sp. 5I1]
MSNLVQKFQEYSDWRKGVVSALEQYRAWIHGSDMADAASDQRISRLLERLVDDKLTIAFVAEFSRGKSELINAIFFADYGQRILPSSAGRTTMCPTELLYDETIPPCIRLLPIETRKEAQSTSDYKGQHHVWTVLPLNISSGDGMLEAFKQVSLTKRVSIEEAKSYGLFDEDDPDAALEIDENGLVEISQWRHAIVNFPHPLLKEGLIIVDTPGLNAIGTEPELTLNLIPNAHAVLFILAADTGVTKSDIDVWRNHIGGGPGRMVVLNKIDSMWDELRTADEIEAQIKHQISTVAHNLSLDEKQIFPVSAQKGLVAKINKDAPLLAKSRLPTLEYALSKELIPSKQDIIRAQMTTDINEITGAQQAIISARTRSVVEQMMELKSLRGKNINVIEHMMRRIDAEKKEFDASLIKMQGTRAVFTRLSTEVYTSLGMDILREEIRKSREAMQKSKFSTGLKDAVKQFFSNIKFNLQASNKKTDEISEMMTIMYRKFSTEHGLALSAPMSFSLDKYIQEVASVEAVFQKQFSTMTLLTTSQVALMQKFFDSIAARVKQSFLQANRDVEAWQKVVMAPLEAQIREHKGQLKNRMQSIQRIHVATDSLEEKISSFEAMQAEMDAKKKALSALELNLKNALLAELSALKVA